ncbi:MAG: hypothetical protein M1820_005053 [Bogoriella megaspora]|nr:MAG: hypothetical protein M1820_005053 [Bogoriella megaspora]
MVPSNFPEEIWTQVLGHLDRKQDRKTIHAVRLVNKSLSRIADPLVYCEIRSEIHQKTPPEGRDKIGQLQRLAWNVACDPGKARFVKEIRLPRYDFVGQHNSGIFPSEQKNVDYIEEQYTTVLRDTALSHHLQDEILKFLKDEAPIGHLCFLLAVCTEIEVLEVRGGTNGIDKLFWKVVLHGAGTIRQNRSHATKGSSYRDKPVLGALRQIHLGAFNYETSLASIEPFLSLPSIRVFEVFGLGDTETWTEHSLPTRLFNPEFNTKHNVEMLLDSCLLSGEGLDWLLSTCDTVTSLTIRWRPGLWTNHLIVLKIGDALRRKGKNLRYLHLDTTGARPAQAGKDAESFGSFANLTRLKTLAVPECAFASSTNSDMLTAVMELMPPSLNQVAEVLPPQLKHLAILGMDDERRSLFKGIFSFLDFSFVLQNGRLKMPALEKVAYVSWYSYDEDLGLARIVHKSVDYDNVEGLHKLDTWGK